MIQARQYLRLALKSRHALFVIRKRVGHDFQRHVAPQLGIRRAIYLSHPARTQLGGDFIMRNALSYHEFNISPGPLLRALCASVASALALRLRLCPKHKCRFRAIRQRMASHSRQLRLPPFDRLL